MRGESAATLVEAAQALRHSMAVVEHPNPNAVLDTCGTGGDGTGTLNISTASAVVVAAAGVPVAKHGNRSISSRCGSADVLEAMGIPMNLSPAAHTHLLQHAHITFLFAPAHHPALKHAASARKDLGIRTIFNALGPLANPARAGMQVMGVYSDALRPLAAEALAALGTRRAWVLRSRDGLDELSPATETLVSEVLASGAVVERVVTPEDFGLSRCGLDTLAGGSAEENATALERLLRGEPHPARTALVLNAAAALVVATEAPLRECAARVQELLDGGHAGETLERWRQESRRLATEAKSP
jgi:anthranilate phosphoribosyltransferase